jgi:alkanesulfonate monooxygenase SsuD/methylene tetrahydromethanopterin reductase-like flavin-dependent oxidoreductase (luciferase family)
VALLAAATERCTVGPCVLQLPLRSAVATAKAMAFADDVSGGRVVVGVGAGEHEAEYAAAGLADRFHHRGRLLDEGIDELRAAWSRSGPEGGDTGDGGGDPGDGSFTMAPARVLPVWVGGRSERARRRAVARGDAWIPHLCRPSWFERRMPDLDADLDRAGRDPASLVRAAVVAVSVDGVEPDVDPTAWLGDLYASDPRTFARVLARGSATQVAAEVDRFRRAGAQHVTLFVAGDHPADHLAPVLDALGP